MAKADTEVHGYPHGYAEQRKLEKKAQDVRRKTLEAGGKLPPICGFTYLPRKSRKSPDAVRMPTVCQRTAGQGSDHPGQGFCNYHEVQVEKETSKGRASQDVVKARQIAYQNANYFGEPTPVDPHEALSQEITRTAGIIQWLESHMTELRDDEGFSPSQVLAQYSKQNGFQPSVWMQLYQSEREHLVKTCTAAIKAGVQERRVKIAEQQGQIIVAMMMALIHDPALGLTSEQMTIAPQLVRGHLLQLPGLTGKDDETHKKADEIVEATVVGES